MQFFLNILAIFAEKAYILQRLSCARKRLAPRIESKLKA